VPAGPLSWHAMQLKLPPHLMQGFANEPSRLQTFVHETRCLVHDVRRTDCHEEKAAAETAKTSASMLRHILFSDAISTRNVSKPGACRQWTGLESLSRKVQLVWAT